MAKKLQLSITDPCHEDWDNMTNAEQGRFCGSCQKQVVDFTSMSDSQLAAFFKKPVQSLSKGGSVCGRFFQDQLGRDVEIPRKRIPWVKYFFQFALPAFLLSAKAAAQGKVVVQSQHKIPEPRLMGFVGYATVPVKGEIKRNLKVEIKGTVVDEKNNPVSYASVIIKGSKNGVMADSNGVFRFSDIIADDFILQVSSAGFQSAEVTVTAKAALTKDIVIQLNGKVLEEVVVVSYPAIVKGQIMMGAVSHVKKKVTDTSFVLPVIEPPVEKPAMIKVYPNPVMAGTSINIGCEKLEEGYYTFRLFNQAGQQVQHKQIWIDAEAGMLNMEIPSVRTGVYFLTLTNKESGKKFTDKIIVE